MKFTYKKFTALCLFLSFFTLLPILIINFLIDPQWVFSKSFLATKYKNTFNERAQKTNFLYFNEIEFDTLIIGSSRSSNIHIGYDSSKIYNYSSSSMDIKEYPGFIENAKSLNKAKTKNILIGLDFFAYLHEQQIAKMPKDYLRDAQSSFYRIKTLFSIDNFKKSRKNMKLKEPIYERVYDENYEIFISKKDENTAKKDIKQSAIKFKERFYDKPNLAKEYKKTLLKIKQNNKNIKIRIFTTPISKELFLVILNNENLYKHYENWLREIVDVFEMVDHFMYLNALNKHSEKNFYDSHHLYPSSTKEILQILIKESCKDICIRLKKTDLEASLMHLKQINFKEKNAF